MGTIVQRMPPEWGDLQPGWEMHYCDVCRLLDKDTSQKPCFFCDKCGAWICKKDNYRMDRRARAAIRMKKESRR